MQLFNFISIFASLITIFAIIISTYVFFTDKTRSWLFFGYKPTAIVILIDSKTKKVLLTKRVMVKNTTRDYPWHFPQGGIYTNDIASTVNGILKEEYDAEPFMYEFNRTHILGKVKINSHKIDKKHNFGSVSLFSLVKGKGYIACVVYTDLKYFKKQIKKVYGLDEVKEMTFDKALALIDPKKKDLLQKRKKEIFE
jgi:hypothetical protein